MSALRLAIALATAFLLLAAPASAATLQYDSLVHLGGGATPAAPLTVRFELDGPEESDPFVIEKVVTPADSGTTWTVDAETAASYGIVWEDIVAAMATPEWRTVRVAFGERLTGYDVAPIHPSETLVEFTLDRIELQLVNYEYIGEVSSRNDLMWRTVTAGVGTVVPEPAGVVMAIVAVLVGVRVRRRFSPSGIQAYRSP